MTDDYDTPWKQLVTDHFADFMAFYFNDAHAAIDWSRPPIFLDQELAALSPDAALGRRLLDKLVRVYLRDGGEQWVLVHVEMQGAREAGFAERIFVYHYRVYDHYRRPLASLAVLADRGGSWRPASFSYALLGCEMRLIFPIVKLHDYADCLDQLLLQENPFALMTAAHLLTQQTRHKDHQRRLAKWRLTRLLYERDWDKQRIMNLFKAIDWMMRLPSGMQTRFMRGAVELQRRKDMTYLTSLERQAIGKGLRQGRRKGLQQGREEGREQGREQGREEGREEGRLDGQAYLLSHMLRKRFGALDPAAQARLSGATARQLSQWALNFVEARSLDEVFRD